MYGTPDYGKGVLHLGGVIIISRWRLPGWAGGMFEVATPAAALEGKVRDAVPKEFVGWRWGGGVEGVTCNTLNHYGPDCGFRGFERNFTIR